MFLFRYESCLRRGEHWSNRSAFSSGLFGGMFFFVLEAYMGAALVSVPVLEQTLRNGTFVKSNFSFGT